MKNIQRVELSCDDLSVHCPFCGQAPVTFPSDNETEISITPCAHTLFIAHDEGFEYRSQIFNKNTGLTGPAEDAQPDLGEESYDSFTDKVTLPNSIKFATYAPAPSFFGAYVGFASDVQG